MVGLMGILTIYQTPKLLPFHDASISVVWVTWGIKILPKGLCSG